MLDFTVLAISFGVILPAELPDKTALAILLLGARYRASYVFAGAAAAFAVQVALALVAGGVLTLLPDRALQAVSGALFFAGALLLFFNRDEGDEGDDEAEHDGEEQGAGEHDAKEQGAGEHDAKEQGAGEHDAKRHNAGEHDAKRHNAGEHDAKRHNAGEHDAKDHEPKEQGAEDHDADEKAGTKAASANQSFWRISGLGFMLVVIAEFGDLTQILTVNLAAHYDSPLSVGLGSLLALWSVAALGILGGHTLMKHVPFGVITRIAAAAMLVLAATSWYAAIVG